MTFESRKVARRSVHMIVQPAYLQTNMKHSFWGVARRVSLLTGSQSVKEHIIVW